MPDPDYDLQRTPGGPLEPEASSNTTKWIILGVIVFAGIGGVWFAMSRPPAVPEQAAEPDPVATVEEPAPLGATPEPVVLPPLDMSDAFVREAVRQLSAHPLVASWLATDGLIRHFVVVVSNVADGNTPGRQLRSVRPQGPFVTAPRGEQTTIDPRSYARYDRHAEAIASIDPQDAARLYATLKPRIEEAYRDLGFPNTPFDRTLTRAFAMLLDAPVVDSPIELVPAGASAYAFADPDLETRPGAQRQLLRMGPGNVRKTQAALRGHALALGIAPDQLPPVR